MSDRDDHYTPWNAAPPRRTTAEREAAAPQTDRRSSGDAVGCAPASSPGSNSTSTIGADVAAAGQQAPQ